MSAQLRPSTLVLLLTAASLTSCTSMRSRWHENAFGVAKAGDPAPPLTFDGLLQAPEGARTDWESLRGKVVVLEFWATWCTVCVGVIPELNKLVERYANEPVVFISVTDEDEQTVRNFLRDNPINGWIALDRDRQTFERFGVRGRPSTAIINKEGTIAGWTFLPRLNQEPEILNQVLAGHAPRQLSTISEPERADPFVDVAVVGGTVEGPKPICQIVIRPTHGTPPPPRYREDGRGIRHYGVNLLTIIQWAWEMPEPRILTKTPLADQQEYDVIVRSRTAWRPRFRRALQDLIQETFDLSVSRESREMDVYVLTVPDGTEPRLTRSWGGVYFDRDSGTSAPSKEIAERMKGGEKFLFGLRTIAEFADDLSNLLGRPVLDETEGIDDDYSFCVPYDPDEDEPGMLIRVIENTYGLQLAPGRRKVDVLIVNRSVQAG